MKNCIEIKNLSKTFKIYKKEAGLKGSIKGLFHRKYKYLEAVNNISFNIKQGEMVGFIGPNGAGKTTILKMLSGLLHPTEGNISILDFIPYERKEKYLKQISLVMGQKNQLWWDLPAIESFNLNKEIYEISDDNYKETLDELVLMLDIRKILNQQVRKLSLGQRMKCELALALLHRPKVLFLDEPTIGLDIVVQKRVREFLKDYNKRFKATIILTSHYMDDVKEICKRVIMINHGQLLFDGDIESLIQNHANYKILAPVFNEKVSREKLQKFGEVKEFYDHKAVIWVKRNEAAIKASQLLNNFDIDDLDINEPKLEDIVEQEFKK